MAFGSEEELLGELLATPSVVGVMDVPGAMSGAVGKPASECVVSLTCSFSNKAFKSTPGVVTSLMGLMTLVCTDVPGWSSDEAVVAPSSLPPALSEGPPIMVAS